MKRTPKPINRHSLEDRVTITLSGHTTMYKNKKYQIMLDTKSLGEVGYAPELHDSRLSMRTSLGRKKFHISQGYRIKKKL